MRLVLNAVFYSFLTGVMSGACIWVELFLSFESRTNDVRGHLPVAPASLHTTGTALFGLDAPNHMYVLDSAGILSA